MKRFLSYWWFKLILVGLGVFLMIQFVPYRVDNPKTRDEPAWDSPRTARARGARRATRATATRPKVLAFEKAAPIKWYIANHVKEGRAALNFSEWHTAAGEEADEAAEAVGDGMPPEYYTYFGLHPGVEAHAGRVPGIDRRSRAHHRRRPSDWWRLNYGRPTMGASVRSPSHAQRDPRSAMRLGGIR